MNAEIISVGTELMIGDIANTDAQYISSRLSNLGINVICHSTVNDNIADIRSALRNALPRSRVIIFTGGLGPTPDDITKETVCSAVGVNLVLDKEWKNKIDEYFARTGRIPTENNYKQAMVPENGVVFNNEHGTAPGCVISAGKQWIIMLPGPPKELYPMFDNEVIPYLQNIGINSNTIMRTISCFGIGESLLASKIDKYLHNDNPIVATYVSDGVVNIKITSKNDNEYIARTDCDKVFSEILAIVGDYAFSVNNETLAEVVVAKLKDSNMKITPAESCTAGLFSAAITSVKGSSEVITSGIVAYSNNVKIDLLGIPEEIIDVYGVYSVETSVEMAKAAYRLGKANIGIGITGIASPDYTTDLPTGLVFVSLYDGVEVYTRKLMLGHGTDDERELVRKGAVNNALDMCRLYLDGVYNRIGNIDNSNNNSDEKLNDFNMFLINSNNVDKNENNENINEDKPNKVEFVPVVKNAELVNEANDLEEQIIPENEEIKKEKNSFLSKIFPTKFDSNKEKVRKILLIVFALVFIGSAIYIANYFIESINTKNQISSIQGLYDPDAEGSLNDDGININFETLIKRNSDTVGWIHIPNTQVSNPVVQRDNDYYLNHDFDCKYNLHGAVFADMNCKINSSGLSKNTVIYAHHMKDGTMFSDLKNYRTDTTDGVSFYKENPVLIFNTIYQTKATKWKIFAVIVTNAQEAQDSGYVFKYWDHCDGMSKLQYAQFLYEAQRRSMIDTGVDVNYDDSIITLSTCIYDFTDARLVVMARKVRDGESEKVDVSKATVNSDCKFPTAYYKGGKVPEDKTSSVVSIEGEVWPESSEVSSMPTTSEFTSNSSSETSSEKNSSSAVSHNTVTSTHAQSNDNKPSVVSTQSVNNPPSESSISSEVVSSEIISSEVTPSEVSSEPEPSSEAPSEPSAVSQVEPSSEPESSQE